MPLNPFTNHRRHKILSTPFPQEWLDILRQNLPAYELLTETEQSVLQDDIQIFIAEKHWEGCADLEVTDEMRVTIAAQACILTLGRRGEHYPNVETVVLYPNTITRSWQNRDSSGVVDQQMTSLSGEAWSNGPVVLSWSDVRRGARHPDDGRNVVYHEFAHKLDMKDGEANGVPYLGNREQVDEWAEVMHAAFTHHVAMVEHGHHTLLDPYGATNGAEFFAVATECFFEQSAALAQEHPDLYRVLRGYFGQDPAGRFS